MTPATKNQAPALTILVPAVRTRQNHDAGRAFHKAGRLRVTARQRAVDLFLRSGTESTVPSRASKVYSRELAVVRQHKREYRVTKPFQLVWAARPAVRCTDHDGQIAVGAVLRRCSDVLTICATTTKKSRSREDPPSHVYSVSARAMILSSTRCPISSSPKHCASANIPATANATTRRRAVSYRQICQRVFSESARPVKLVRMIFFRSGGVKAIGAEQSRSA